MPTQALLLERMTPESQLLWDDWVGIRKPEGHMEKKQELGLGKLPPSKVSLRTVAAQKAPAMSPPGQECATPLLSTP